MRGFVFDRHSLHRLCLYGVPVFIALVAALLPPDANFDLANYHYYNPWAYLSGHGARDLAPNGVTAFFNPLLDMPFYWANAHLPGRVVAFLLGLSHGACFVLLYLLARVAVFRETDLRSIAASAGVAGAGITAGVSLSELGTTFYDCVGTAGVLLCLVLLARHHFRRATGLAMVVLAGVVLGMTVGLKLTNVVYAAGVAFAVPFLVSPPQRLRLSGAFAAGGIAGLAVTGGFWMIHLWQNFGNPIYPFFNNVFHSPYATVGDGRDMAFMPHGWFEALFYPLVFTFHPLRTIEFPIRDFRFLALYLAIPAGAVLLAATRRRTHALNPEQRRYLAFLLMALAISYVAWLGLFSIRRYGLAFEMLAPLLIAFIARGLPRGRALVSGVIIAFLVVTTTPKAMGRGEWQGFDEHIVDAQLPVTVSPNSLVLLTGWGAKAFLAPFFPTDSAFVAMGKRKTRNLDYSREISRRIATHSGPILALAHQSELASLHRLAAYGLAPHACRPIHSTVDRGDPVMMCEVARLNAVNALQKKTP